MLGEDGSGKWEREEVYRDRWRGEGFVGRTGSTHYWVCWANTIHRRWGFSDWSEVSFDKVAIPTPTPVPAIVKPTQFIWTLTPWTEGSCWGWKWGVDYNIGWRYSYQLINKPQRHQRLSQNPLEFNTSPYRSIFLPRLTTSKTLTSLEMEITDKSWYPGVAREIPILHKQGIFNRDLRL